MLTRKESFICVLVCPHFLWASFHFTRLDYRGSSVWTSLHDLRGWAEATGGTLPRSFSGSPGSIIYRQAERTSTTGAFGCDANASVDKTRFPRDGRWNNLIQYFMRYTFHDHVQYMKHIIVQCKHVYFQTHTHIYYIYNYTYDPLRWYSLCFIYDICYAVLMVTRLEVWTWQWRGALKLDSCGIRWILGVIIGAIMCN